MECLNNVIGYREDLLANRAIVKHGNFALLIPDGLVKNTIPGFEDCDATVLSTSKLDASFVDYPVTLHQDGDNQRGFDGEDIKMFLYVISGNITAEAEGKTLTLSESGYLYCPPGSLMTFVNVQAEDSQVFLYRRHYIPVEGHMSWLVPDNASGLERIHCEGTGDVILPGFLSKELGFDMNMHILFFAPGAGHDCIETHVQERDAYILSGRGVYNLGNNWIPVKKGDYIFMGAYPLQAGYGVGRGGAFSYIYSKDYNRNVEIWVIPLTWLFLAVLDFAAVYSVAFFVVNSGKKGCDIDCTRSKGNSQFLVS